MIKFGMFNSINGDRRYKAEDFAQYFATFIGNGIFVKPSDCLQIFANGDSMSVFVRPGKAWINGYYLINDDNYTLPLSAGDITLNRIDRIVIRLDFVQRKMSVEVKKGTLSASPVAPTLKRDADAYELALADVYIAKGALTINQAAVTDTRLNNNLCGLMHNPIYQVDTTTLFNQYQSWFDDYSVTKAAEFLAWQTDVTTALEDWIDAQEQGFEAWRQAEEQLYYTWLNGKKNDFDTWFATIKDILDSNAAGHLQLQIDNHLDASRPHKYLDTGDNKVYEYGLQRNPDLNAAAFVYAESGATEANVINLPTWEQVEEAKNVTLGTGGMLLDINNKKYKAVMADYVDLKVGIGSGYLDPLQASFAEKYPLLSPTWNIRATRRVHLWNNIHMSWNGLTYAFVNMDTLEVINAGTVVNEHFKAMKDYNWFSDAKYLYVRGQSFNGGGNTTYVVFDKLSFQYVTVIRQSGSGIIHGVNDSICEIVCQGTHFFVPSSQYQYLFVYRLVYDGIGMPVGFEFRSNIQIGGGQQYPKACWDDGEFIYVIFTNHTTLYTIEKFKYDPSTNTNNRVGINTISDSSPAVISQWSWKYKADGKNFILLSFGTTNNNIVVSINFDTLTLNQRVAVGSVDNSLTLDYKNGDIFYFQSYNIVGYVINGNPFENISKYTLLSNGWWAPSVYYVPAQQPINPNSSVGRIYLMGNQAFMKDRELYLKAGPKEFSKLEDAHAIQCYKEVN